MIRQTDLGPRIGIDLLGSDTPPSWLFKSVIEFFKLLSYPVQLVVFATEDVFAKISYPDSFRCITVKEFITMEEDPLVAIRRKKESSVCVGIRMLKNYELDAFVSAGNTGALMACSKLELSMLPGIDRPGLMALIPTKQKPLVVIDVGANVSATAEQIVQFALMGIAYQKTRDIAHPVVGLLNIGEEEKKGTPELRKAYQQLQQLNQDSPLDHPVFVGNIEGRDAFQGDLDVLVTDGFTGNVFLKTAEGIASFILEDLQNTSTFDCSPELKSILHSLHHRLHYDEYPGAILCGVDGIVMKCHGKSSPTALVNTIKGAIRLVEHFFLEKIKAELSSL